MPRCSLDQALVLRTWPKSFHCSTLSIMGKRGTPRASCDPCRRKKVKCDKEQRNAEGISLCSFCCTRGYDCVITDDTRPNADRSDNDDGPSTESASASTSAAKKKRKQSDADDGSTQNGPSGSARDSSFVPDPFVTPGPATEPDMLSVRGLTRAILDDSVSSHFRTTYWCNPVVNPHHFYPRYRRYLSKLDNAPSSSTDHDIFPPADILILAVACAGVVQLSMHRIASICRLASIEDSRSWCRRLAPKTLP